MKKKVEKKNKSKYYSSNEVVSILENIDGGIKVVSEQHGDIIKKLNEHDQKFDILEEKVDLMHTRLVNVEGKVDLIQDDITEIKHKLSEKVDREEFNKLENRMVKLEKLVFAKV